MPHRAATTSTVVAMRRASACAVAVDRGCAGLGHGRVITTPVERLYSRRVPLVTVTHRRRAGGAPRAHRGRRRRAARRVDGHVGAGAGVAAREGAADRRGRGDRRGRQPVVHAPGRLRARAADRRAHGLGAERRLARRLPQRGRGRRGAAADRRGGHAAADGAARQLGRRGRRALRPLALRLVGRGRIDARPGRAAQARRP